MAQYYFSLSGCHLGVFPQVLESSGYPLAPNPQFQNHTTCNHVFLLFCFFNIYFSIVVFHVLSCSRCPTPSLVCQILLLPLPDVSMKISSQPTMENLFVRQMKLHLGHVLCYYTVRPSRTIDVVLTLWRLSIRVRLKHFCLSVVRSQNMR